MITDKIRQGLLNTTMERSSAEHFELAKLQWELKDVVYRDDNQHCICGQPIKECCILQNKVTHRKMLVGRNCTERFFGINTLNVFKFLKKLENNKDEVIPEPLIGLFVQLGYVYDTEVAFLKQLTTQKTLSEKQSAWRSKIVYRVLNKLVVRKDDAI